MTQNQVKNLGFCGLITLLMAARLLPRFSLIGLAGAAVALGACFIAGLAFNKQQGLAQKLDLYVLFTAAGILAVHYQDLLADFSLERLVDHLSGNAQARLVVLVFSVAVSWVLGWVAKARTTLAAQMIWKYAGRFVLFWGVTTSFSGPYDPAASARHLLIFALLGLVAYNRASWTGSIKASGRFSRIGLIVAILWVIFPVLFPTFRLTGLNLPAFINETLLPWYGVVALTLALAAISGMGFYTGKMKVDEDSVLLAGAVGLVWVVKASVYHYFAFYWLAVGVYVLLCIGLANRLIAREKAGDSPALDDGLAGNPFYGTLLAALCMVGTVFLISRGYVYLWLALALGTLVVLFVNKNAVGWVKDALFWISLLLSIGGAACALSVQRGFSMAKLTLIVALFLLAAVAMLMLNHKNDVGHNSYRVTKVAMVVVFALLVLIPALKAGSDIQVTFENKSAHVGALVLEPSRLHVEVVADGKDNGIVKLSYVWSDSFWFEEGDAQEALSTSLELEIENYHLIVWAEDIYGVVTRRDCWFYDGAPAEDIGSEVFRIEP